MNQQQISESQTIEGFTCSRIEEIPELRCTAYVFTHAQTGTPLLHLYNDDPNNLFSIAFRTPVSDSTGVPHILEHSVLGGSRKFPLKDPFQELLKGSLQTFLNALTYPDKTVYPVSSQVEADFFNLVDVYCDAVFHPLLTRNTFCQEGWRFNLDHEDAPVGITGIVYNEMKGVFSDFASHVERRTVSLLFPDTSYFYESGGEPEHITDLTYEQFKRFHAQYYHPSNSFIVLYGNIPSKKTLGFLDTAYLSAFDRTSSPAEIMVQPDWKGPRRAVIDAPATEKDNGLATIAIAWKVGHSSDPLISLVGRILYRYLMGTESSPLKRALIDSGLGEDLDDICGFETEFVHGIFSVGLRKSRPEHTDAIESLVFDTLQKQFRGGLDERLLEGAIRQTEFRLREITDAGRFPFNLLLAERCYRSWLYGGDPLAHLAFEKPLSIIREKKNQGCGWFGEKLRELLIDNPHYLRITVRASSGMGKKLETQSQEQARLLSANFSVEDRKRIHEQTKQLAEEQKKPSPPEAVATLPRLRKADLPPRNQEVPTVRTRIAEAEAFLHPLFTSGIVYCDIGFDCTNVPPDLLMYLPLYCELLTKCGAAGVSYEDMSTRISLSTGGIDSSIVCETKAGTTSPDLVFSCFVHAKALRERCGEMVEILWDLFHAPDLSNTKQIKDVLLEMRNDLNASVIDSGHHFAVTHASSHLVRSRHLDEALAGITQLRFLDQLVRTNAVDDIAQAMKKLHAAVIGNRACTVSLTADDPSQIATGIERLIASLPANAGDPGVYDFSERHVSIGIEISSSVNFVAKAWNLGTLSPESQGRFLLLSRNLSTGYLWDKVRVQGGAYGGMAMISGGHPVFACASYRDPNLSSTLSHFEKGIAEVAAAATSASGLDEAAVDQSIIGTIGRIDAPRTPHEKAFGETVSLVCGRTPELRQQIREAVLSATRESLGATAQELLDNRHTAVTVLGTAPAFDKAEKEDVFFAREALFSEE
jgi:Zn-dependent M16 (insulinase) family peptidase